jgi:hypothetical protein
MHALVVSGNRITDVTGAPVTLRGFGVPLLNWEHFILGFPGTEHELRGRLAGALGAERAEWMTGRWLDYLFGREDVEYIARLGANSIRLAMNYRHFERDDAPFQYLERGFDRVRQVLDWCAEFGVYVVLDLHALPGSQNPDWHSDNHTRTALLWGDAHFQDRTVRLWEELARRFAMHPALAGYDLINEPCTTDIDGHAPLNRLYDRLVKAIRAIDGTHLIILEGDQFGGKFEGLEWPEGPNIVASLHDYSPACMGPGAYPGTIGDRFWDGAFMRDSFSRRQGVKFVQQHNVPLWVGEFGARLDAPVAERSDRLRALSDHIAAMESFGAGWSIWYYKGLAAMGLAVPGPQSCYLRLTEGVRALKEQLHVDTWLRGAEMTRTESLIQELAGHVAGLVRLPAGPIEEALTQRVLGDYAGDLLQDQWVDVFAGLSDERIDEALHSFALDQCRINRPFEELLKRCFAQKES